MREWKSAFASFSNWRVRNQPFASASSFAFCTMPVPPAGAGVRTTFAPRKRISLRRSTLNDSAIVTTSGYPFAAHTMASPMPVLPLVASITVWPGLERAPLLRVFDHAERESILDRAEWIERFDLHVEIDVRRGEPPILTTGVLPTVSRMLAKRVIGRTWF